MRYFSVDVPDGVREFLGFCARNNTLKVDEAVTSNLFPTLTATWEQWADQQDNDIYNNGSFVCVGVNVYTDTPFFHLGLHHAVWENYHDEVAGLVDQAITHKQTSVLEAAVWMVVVWEHAEQHNGRGRYNALSVEGSALQVLINDIPMPVLDNILFRCHEHAIKGTPLHQWLEHQHALRTHVAVSDAVDFSHKATTAKKM